MKKRPNIIAKLRKFIGLLGPGLITGASDDDPSGIATYSQAGAGFGFMTLWTALLTFPLMAGIQEMCARIGIVTRQGLAGTLKEHYPRPILYIVMLLSFPAITLNIGADIQGMGAVTHLLFPAVPAFAFSIVITLVMGFVIVQYKYRSIARILKWLCVSLLLYIIVPFLVDTDWATLAKNAVIPRIEMNAAFFSILVAILGTTISPYLFFWQATMEVEDMARHKKLLVVDKKMMSDMSIDVNVGMFFSNLVMFFIIAATGAVLYKNGIRQIDTVDQAAKALEPLAGRFAYLLFAVGVIGTGFLAVPVLAGCLSYMLAETFGWQEGLDKTFGQARGFYNTLLISLVLGLFMEFLGISPINALIYTAILYGLTAPVLIAIIIHICNSKKIMGEYTNGLLSNILGVMTFILMTAAGIAMVYFQFK